MMKKFHALVLCLFLWNGLLAQSALFSQRSVKLIGVKSLDEQGLLLIQKSKKKCHVLLQRLDVNGQTAWQADLPVPKLSGYHFNKVQIHHDASMIYWIDQLDEQAKLSLISMADGRILKQDVSVSDGLTLESDPLDLTVYDQGLQLFRPTESQVHITTIDSNGAQKARLLFQLDQAMGLKNLDIHGSIDQHVYSSAYTVKKDHSSIRLCMVRTDLKTGDTTMRISELELDQMSFTYNSTVDHRLFSVLPAKNGFFLLGKLDHAFAKAYPKTKLTEAFVGVWIAKVTPDLNIQFFRQIPFQHFQGMVNKDVVTRAAVLSVYEDHSKSIIVNINERQEVFYGNKYAITLGPNGFQRAINGGRDQHHFFEYNTRGLHAGAKSSHVRIMNDDWSYYSTSNLHMMRYIEDLHSPTIGQIGRRAEEWYMDFGEMIYQVSTLGDRTVLLEYLDRKGGQLSIYPL